MTAVSDRRIHPWHRVGLSAADRRLLWLVEQRLALQHPGEPAGRIIRMVHGTARLLRSAGVVHERLVEQVEAACHAALEQGSPPCRHAEPVNGRRSAADPDANAPTSSLGVNHRAEQVVATRRRRQ